MNLTSDLYLVFIPVPMMWRARMPTRKKLGLSVLFSGAFFVMAAAIARCVLTLRVSFPTRVSCCARSSRQPSDARISDQDPADGPSRGAAWALRECFVAIVTSNLPMLWTYTRKRVGPSLLTQLRMGSRRLDRNTIMLVDRGTGFAWDGRGGRSDSHVSAASETVPDLSVHESSVAPTHTSSPPPLTRKTWNYRPDGREAAEAIEVRE